MEQEYFTGRFPKIVIAVQVLLLLFFCVFFGSRACTRVQQQL